MLLNFRPAPTPFHVPSWDRDVFIRALTEAERKTFSDQEDEISGDNNERIKEICKIGLVFPDGSPVFEDSERLPDNLTLGGFYEIHQAIFQLTLGTFEQAKKN